MSILSVVKDVALGIGVNPPTSMFAASVQPRTQAELLSLANEMAQRIAYDVREWRELKLFCTFTGPGTPVAPYNWSDHPLPANYRRMLLSSQVYASWMPRQPLSYVADTDEWLVRRMSGMATSYSEYTLIGNSMLIYPALAAGHSVSFAYLDKNCVSLNSGGYGDQFLNDLDTFRLPERILKLGMLWQWKANKGAPYAEDMGTYTDALFMYAGSNQPAPILVDHAAMRSLASPSYPYPLPDLP